MRKYKIFQFLEEDNGNFSSTRLFALLLVISAIIDYQHSIWVLGIWKPTIEVVGLIISAIGIKVLQKGKEEKPLIEKLSDNEL